MKIKQGVKLEEYGFIKTLKEPNIDNYNMDIDEEAYKYYDDCHSFESQDDFLEYYEYFLNIGHSRRGQCYYLLVNSDNILLIITTKPDGEGGSVLLPDILINMIKDNCVIV